MVHSDGIWNDLELQRNNENKDGKWCILTVFETIWNCREKTWKQGRLCVHSDSDTETIFKTAMRKTVNVLT